MNEEKKNMWLLILQVLKVVITAVAGYLGGAAVSSCANHADLLSFLN